MVSVDVREVIVAGWWRGWELCSELGSFGSTGRDRKIQDELLHKMNRIDR